MNLDTMTSDSVVVSGGESTSGPWHPWGGAVSVLEASDGPRKSVCIS